ncbi:hypothetical protein AB205_0058040, partial [Aquarana catesbeiana]
FCTILKSVLKIHISTDNQAAVVATVSGYLGVVKDALEEMEQALASGEDPFSDVLEDDETGARGNQDTYWSEADHRLIAPCLGLMKASKACMKKVLGALKTHGKVETADQVAQLDDLADITQEVSPSVDELALSMYPPMNQAAVRFNVRCKVVLCAEESAGDHKVCGFFIVDHGSHTHTLS